MKKTKKGEQNKTSSSCTRTHLGIVLPVPVVFLEPSPHPKTRTRKQAGSKRDTTSVVAQPPNRSHAEARVAQAAKGSTGSQLASKTLTPIASPPPSLHADTLQEQGMAAQTTEQPTSLQPDKIVRASDPKTRMATKAGDQLASSNPSHSGSAVAPSRQRQQSSAKPTKPRTHLSATTNGANQSVSSNIKHSSSAASQPSKSVRRDDVTQRRTTVDGSQLQSGGERPQHKAVTMLRSQPAITPSRPTPPSTSKVAREVAREAVREAVHPQPAAEGIQRVARVYSTARGSNVQGESILNTYLFIH